MANVNRWGKIHIYLIISNVYLQQIRIENQPIFGMGLRKKLYKGSQFQKVESMQDSHNFFDLKYHDSQIKICVCWKSCSCSGSKKKKSTLSCLTTRSGTGGEGGWPYFLFHLILIMVMIWVDHIFSLSFASHSYCLIPSSPINHLIE